MLLSVLFVSIAAIFNSIMDRVGDGTAFSRSIFSHLNPKWWSKEVSWEYVKFLPFTKYRPDAWHLSKSGMIVFITLAIVFYNKQIHWGVDFLILGTLWNLVFNTFYNHIFKKVGS